MGRPRQVDPVRNELAVVLRAQGRDVIRATIDDSARAQRYRRGEYSAEGCYFDSHNCDALNRVLFDPFGPAGNRRSNARFMTAPPMLRRPGSVTTSSADAVLIFDGMFLAWDRLVAGICASSCRVQWRRP